MRNESGQAENLKQSRHHFNHFIMFNNKRSLLVRVRIAMVAIVTILGLSGAYAMTPAQHQDATTWGVVATNANSYEVTAITANSQCLSSQRICKVHSEVAPTNGELSMDDATPVLDEPGTFVK